jgi:hypothetical protein
MTATSLKQFESFSKEEINTIVDFIESYLTALEEQKEQTVKRYNFLESIKKAADEAGAKIFNDSSSDRIESFMKEYTTQTELYKPILTKLKKIQDVIT